MKYEVVFYANEKDTVLIETDDFEKAKNLVKGYVKKYHMKPMKIYDKEPMIGVILSYSNMNESKIEMAIGIIIKG